MQSFKLNHSLCQTLLFIPSYPASCYARPSHWLCRTMPFNIQIKPLSGCDRLSDMGWNSAILTYLFFMSDCIIQTFTFGVADPATFRHSLSDPAIQTFRPSHLLHQTLSSIQTWPFHVGSAHSNIETLSHSLCQTIPLKQSYFAIHHSLIQTLLVQSFRPFYSLIHHSLCKTTDSNPWCLGLQEQSVWGHWPHDSPRDHLWPCCVWPGWCGGWCRCCLLSGKLQPQQSRWA